MPGNLENLSAIEQKELLVGLLSQLPERVFPLSRAQQRLWFLDRLYPGNPVYNVPFGLRLQGDLNRKALELSVHALIERHEILRTRFATQEAQPVQIVEADSIIDIPFVDLSEMPTSDRHTKAYRIATEQARLAFNLDTGPLLHLSLIRLAAEEHLFLCVMHHIVCDAWSLEILIRELAALYVQYSGGTKASLTRLPLQYGEYSQWQRELVAGNRLPEQAEYWKHKLLGAPAFLDLPTDHIRPLEQSYDGTSQVISIPKELVDDLATFGRAQGATLFMVMLTAFEALLHCYTKAEDILVGVPIADRNRIELEDLVGFFVNTLVLRVDLSGNASFCDLLLRVREGVLGAFANADLPFESLVKYLKPERTLSYSPVIQVMFSSIKAKKLPSFGNVSARRYLFGTQTSPFDLSVEFIEDAEDHWWLQVTYATSLFEYARMAKLLDDYLTLLKTVAARPELRIHTLASLLSDKEGAATPRTPYISGTQAENRAASELGIPGLYSKDKTEPRDALEQILVRIWERVLGYTGIGIHDNFFDRGGHSLLAAQLISEVEKVVGHKIPLSALFRASTVESLADVIRDGTAWTPDPLLMELNAGTHGFPLFAIVQPGWDALGYALLARHMGPEQPFYKVQAPTSTHPAGLLSIEELHTLACDYIAAIRTVRPKGPYFLVAMCYGAQIAEQMVLELESQGHEVGFLGIIDTFVLEHSHIRWLTQLKSFRRGRQNISQLPLSAQASHYKQAIKKRLRCLFLRKTEPEDLWVRAFWPGKEFQVKQFNAPVLLFRNPKQEYFKVRDPKMGWGARSLSGVNISTLNDVKHEQMLREPAVEVIASQLKSALHRH